MLVGNLAELNEQVTALSQLGASQLLDNLRIVERRAGLVFTLFRSSEWAILADQTNEPDDDCMGN
jgi:hypothetical protein